MRTSAASPKILDAAVRHTPLKSATLFAGRVGNQPRLQWEIDNVFVSSYQINGSTGGTPHLNDEVSLTFTRLKVTYVPTLPNGKPGTPVGFSYDFAKGG
jgi:type VI protein secretion system component Hcp